MRIAIVTTGGTIAKTYDEADGLLKNERPVIKTLVGALRLPDLAIDFSHLMQKDSLELTDDDRRRILAEVEALAPRRDGLLVIHGTDTLEHTGALIHESLPELAVPVVLTGAMRPYEFRDSDAQQNVTEALLAATLVPPGVYAAMHGRVLRFPGVTKDRQALTFVKREAG